MSWHRSVTKTSSCCAYFFMTFIAWHHFCAIPTYATYWLLLAYSVRFFGSFFWQRLSAVNGSGYLLAEKSPIGNLKTSDTRTRTACWREP
eukprot:scaffold650550_cov50-Prasinocladus_malaysianus.AAC.1